MTRAGVLAAALLCVATTCAGFELLRVSGDPCDNGSRNLTWPSSAAPVDVRFVVPPDLKALAATAQERWNSNVRRFRFSSGSGSPCDLADGIVSVTFSNTHCGGQPLDDALAVTTSRWYSDGRLVDAEIVVNVNSVARTNEAVFLEVVMHELGHVLGLDHSDACGNSGAGTLMKSVLVLGQPRLDRPQEDDIAGADFAYPAGGSGGVPEGANSCAVQAPPRMGAGLALLLVPIILLARPFVRHRARPRPGCRHRF
jgi:hypothetical protein